MDNTYLPGSGFTPKPKNIYSDVPVPWQLKLISLFVFLESVNYFFGIFAPKKEMAFALSGISLFLFLISFVVFVALWNGKKWAREVVMFLTSLSFLETVGNLYQFGFYSMKGEYTFVYQLVYIVTIVINTLIIIYLWKIRKINYGFNVVSYDYEKTTVSESISPEIQKLINKGEPVLKIKKRKTLLSYGPLILFVLNVPFFILDFITFFTPGGEAGLGGIIFFLHLIFASASLPFIIWSIVSDSKIAKIISLVCSLIFLLPGIFFMAFLLFARLVSLFY